MVFEKLILIFILAIFSTPTLLFSSSHYNFPIAKPNNPNCNDTCGDIQIPFPFGTTPECSFAKQFQLTCNHTASDPPKLLWWKTTIEITDISLDGQFTLMKLIAHDCYHGNGVQSSNFSNGIHLRPHFTLNNTANKFTILGCSAIAVFTGISLDQTFVTAGAALCSSEADLREGTCNGAGCFQIDIPTDVSEYYVLIQSVSNYTNTSSFSNCTYAFAVERSAFQFSKDNLTNLLPFQRLPVVVDWVIGNGTCQEARRNATSYACVNANTKCYDPTNGYGYRCRCEDGFEGNPYLPQGCIGITNFILFSQSLIVMNFRIKKIFE